MVCTDAMTGGGPRAAWRIRPRGFATPGQTFSPSPTGLVELCAPGYPGSTYTLRYEPQRDQLEGVYDQAALQQRFDVVFVRVK